MGVVSVVLLSPPFLPASAILFLQMQLKYHLFSKILSTKGANFLDVLYVYFIDNATAIYFHYYLHIYHCH